MAEAQSKDSAEIKALETLATDYKSKCLLTDDFFCRFNGAEDSDLVMQFETYGDNLVRPCCKKGNHFDFEQKRIELLFKLHRMEERITKFYDLLVTIRSEKLVFANPQGFSDDAAALQETSKKIEKIVRVCLDPLYAEGIEALEQFPQKICEPMDTMVAEIEAAFYPRMFQIEKDVGEARVTVIKASLLGKIYAAITYVIGAVQAVRTAIVAGSNYIYTYGLAGFRRFANAFKTGLKDVFKTICLLDNDTTTMRYYVNMEKFIDKVLKTNAIIRAKVTNSFQKFLDSKIGRKLLHFVALAAQKIGDWLQKAANLAGDTITPIKLKIFADEIIEWLEKNKNNRHLVLTTKQVRQWFYVLCSFTFNVVTTMFGYFKTFGCGSIDKLLTYLERKNNKETELIADSPEEEARQQLRDQDPPNVEQLDAQDDADAELVEDLPFDPAVKPEPVVDPTKNTKSKKEVERAQERANKTASVVNVLFKFFWYFSKNSFIPKEDIASDLEKYKDLEAYKNATVPHLAQTEQYVRYAYCRSQAQFKNDDGKDACLHLSRTAKSIIGESDAAARQNEYSQKARIAYHKEETERRAKDEADRDAKEAEEREKLVRTEAEIRAQIMKTITEARIQTNTPVQSTDTHQFIQPTAKPLAPTKPIVTTPAKPLPTKTSTPPPVVLGPLTTITPTTQTPVAPSKTPVVVVPSTLQPVPASTQPSSTGITFKKRKPIIGLR